MDETTSIFLAIGSAAFGILMGHVTASKRSPDLADAVFPTAVYIFSGGLICARVAFAIEWWPIYRQRPLDLLRFSDGGFDTAVGVLGAFSFALLLATKNASLRRPMGSMLIGGATAYVLGWLLLDFLSAAPVRLPDTVVTSLSGERVELSEFLGRPVVVNVWATWCPPCRREMPFLLQVQAEHPGVHFLLVNQGETAAEVSFYAESINVSAHTFFLDLDSDVAEALGAPAYPSTYFFNQDGELETKFLGELSEAGLRSKMSTITTGPYYK